MAQKLKSEIAEAKQRLDEAQRIAAALERSPHLHHLSMKAVFALEDYLFELQATLDLVEGRVRPPSWLK